MVQRVRPLLSVPMHGDDRLRWLHMSDRYLEVADQVNRLSADVVTVSGSTIVAETLVLVDASAGTVVCTLVDSKDFRDREMVIKKIDSGSNPVLALGSVVDGTQQQIDGATTSTVAVSQYDATRLIPDGRDWWKA